MSSIFPSQAIVQGARESRFVVRYDLWLIGAVLTLVALGLVMVASASVSIAERRELVPLYYFWRQLIAVGLGVADEGVHGCHIL